MSLRQVEHIAQVRQSAALGFNPEVTPCPYTQVPLRSLSLMRDDCWMRRRSLSISASASGGSATGSKALEEGQASEALKVENQDLRLRMAFNDECHAFDVSDREAIWKLAGDDIKVAVNEDGTVDPAPLRTVVGSLVERYPHSFVTRDLSSPALPVAGARTARCGQRRPAHRPPC
jgi:hypothetical protein